MEDGDANIRYSTDLKIEAGWGVRMRRKETCGEKGI